MWQHDLDKVHIADDMPMTCNRIFKLSRSPSGFNPMPALAVFLMSLPCKLLHIGMIVEFGENDDGRGSETDF